MRGLLSEGKRVMADARSVAPTLQGLAAVDDQGAAGDVTRVRGEQEEDRVDDVIRTCGPAQRDAAKNLRRQRCLTILVVHHQTQADGIDANRVWGARQR
ncbi:MAG: hypothetical protein K0S14_1493 [Thermomicrobiales bacterium]|nr:hypothetical protein [Thermomicrobiales bacterium]